jgi:hypothetical protein
MVGNSVMLFCIFESKKLLDFDDGEDGFIITITITLPIVIVIQQGNSIQNRIMVGNSTMLFSTK